MVQILILTLGLALLITKELYNSIAKASKHVDNIYIAYSLVTKVIKRIIDFLNSYLNSLLL
jgi:hypothetical protein